MIFEDYHTGAHGLGKKVRTPFSGFSGRNSIELIRTCFQPDVG